MNNQNANNQTQKKSGNGGLVAILAVLLVLLAAAVGCYLFGVFGNEPILTFPSSESAAEEESIVGKWKGDIAGETVIFREDGTCTIAGTNWDYEYKDGELTVSKYGFGYTVKADFDGDSLSFTLSKIKYDLERID